MSELFYTKVPISPTYGKYTVGCCGAMEIIDLYGSVSPINALQGLEKYLKGGYPSDSKHNPPVYLIFSAIVARGDSVLFGDPTRSYPPKDGSDYGPKFAAFIEDHDLGQVVTLPPGQNWTKNMIQLWLWKPNYEKLWRILEENREKK